MSFSKMNKKGLIEYIVKNANSIKEKSLVDRIKYTLKKAKEDFKAVTADVLVQIAEDMEKLLATPAPVENAIKLVKKPAAKTEVDVDKAVDALEKIASEAKPKNGNGKPAPKTENKKPETPKAEEKKSAVESQEANVKQIQLAKQFPSELKTELGTLKVNMDALTIADIHKMLNDGKDLVLAMYWNSRHLKQFEYDTYGVAGKKFKSFENDLDLTKPMYVSEDGKVVYTISVYSEVMYTITPDDLEIIEGMRCSSGLEFNIYEVVEEQPELEKQPEKAPEVPKKEEKKAVKEEPKAETLKVAPAAKKIVKKNK